MAASVWMDLLLWMNEPQMSNMLYQVVVFIASIAILAKFSEVVVSNSVKLAKMTRLGELVIGFIFLSIATNIPEISVAFSSIVSGNVDITIGNILGSNVANIGLVLAIHGIMAPIVIKKGTFERLPTMLFLSSIIPLMLLTMNHAEKYVGVMLIGAFAAFSLYSVRKNISLSIMKSEPKGIIKQIMMPIDLYKTIISLVFSVMVVLVSSNFVVSSSSEISRMAGIAESILGATIISIGTTLPELSVSFTAIRTKHNNLGLGNILGSSLTKITLILGAVFLLSPVTINMEIYSMLLLFVIAISMISWYFFTTERRLDRREGVILLFIYILFLMSTFGLQLRII